MSKEDVLIWDNDTTWDRYTILDEKSGYVYGASINPYHPQGFGQCAGNVLEWIKYDVNFRKKCKSISDLIKYYDESTNIGKQIKYDDLPEKVKKYIKYVTSDNT